MPDDPNTMKHIARHRTRLLKRLLWALGGVFVVMLLLGIVVYLETQTVQSQLIVLVLFGALVAFGLSYWSVNRGRLKSAGYLVFAAVFMTYVASELLFSGIGITLLVAGAVVLLLVGRLALPNRWLLWGGSIVGYLAWVLLVEQVLYLPFQRFDITTLPQFAALVPVVSLFLVALVGWVVLRSLSFGTIRTRLLIGFVIIVLVPLMLSVLVSANVSQNAGRDQVASQLESVVTLKSAEIRTWLETLQADLSIAIPDDETTQEAETLLTEAAVPVGQQFARERLLERFNQLTVSPGVEAMAGAGRFVEIFLMDLNGQVVLSTNPIQSNKIFGRREYFRRGLEGPYIHPPELERALGMVTVVFSQPVRDESDAVVGVLAGRADLSELNRIMLERAGLGSTGETYLISLNRALLTESRFGLLDWYTDVGERVNTEAARVAVETGAQGVGEYVGYYGEAVLGVYRWLPMLDVVLVAEQRLDEALAATAAVTRSNFGIAVLAGIGAVVASLFVTRGIANPLSRLAQTATRIAAGDLDLTADVQRDDEIGALAEAFNTMTAQLRDLIDNLEKRVVERTRDLELTAELGRIATGMRDLDTLLPYAVNLIQKRTPYYHVQVFLLDDNNDYALLRASTGEPGYRLLEAGHRLARGSASVIGRVTERSQPVIVHDTQDPTVIHRPNPLLPDTRSEMALPLRVGERVIGALDVQSLEPNSFDDADVRVFSLLADQLAIAIDNALLFEESRQRLHEIDMLNQRLVGEAWRDYLRQRGAAILGAVADGRQTLPEIPGSPLIDQAKARSRPVSESDGGIVTVALPLRLRGVQLGVLTFEVEGETLDPESLEVAQALGDRLTLSLENARLFEQSQRLAQRERVVNQVSGRLTGKTDISDLLQTAIRELGQALQVSETAIQLVGFRSSRSQANGDEV